MGRDSRRVAKIAECRASSSSGISKVTSMDLLWLRQRAEKSKKISSIADMFSVVSVAPSSRKIVLLAYYRSRIPYCQLII